MSLEHLPTGGIGAGEDAERLGVLFAYAEERQADAALRADLAALSRANQEEVFKLIRHLRPSANTLREFLRLAGQICARDKTDFSFLLAAPQVAELFTVECRLGAKERQKELRRFLEKQRFPVLAKIEAELEACRKEILRSTGLRIAPPEELEGDSLRLELQFRNPAELHQLAEKMTQLANQPELGRIFSLLKGEL